MTRLRNAISIASVAVVVVGIHGEFGPWWAMILGGGFVFVVLEVLDLAAKRKGNIP